MALDVEGEEGVEAEDGAAESREEDATSDGKRMRKSRGESDFAHLIARSFSSKAPTGTIPL